MKEKRWFNATDRDDLKPWKARREGNSIRTVHTKYGRKAVSTAPNELTGSIRSGKLVKALG